MRDPEKTVSEGNIQGENSNLKADQYPTLEDVISAKDGKVLVQITNLDHEAQTGPNT